MAHGPRLPTADELQRKKEPVDVVIAPFARFARLEASGGILLLAMTAIALIWANSGAADSYFNFFDGTKLFVGHLEPPLEGAPAEPVTGDEVGFAKTIGVWIDDALMGFFFLLVGLEIKREMVVGELSSPRKAALPIAAALGGMIVPAAIYAAINWGEPTIRGWGVPMATDIAFALGVLSLVGRSIPASLRVFLTSLAIVDDLGALLIIALFYTDDLAVNYLGLAGAVTAVLIVLNLMHVRHPIVYMLISMPLWYFIYKSGVHATLTGVILAMTIPVTGRVEARRFIDATEIALDEFRKSDEPNRPIRANPTQLAAAIAIIRNCRQVLPPLNRIEHALIPWVAFFIVPVFALANAGVTLGEGTGQLVTSDVSIGIALGLLIGKPVGVVGFSWLALKLGIGSLPSGSSWRQLIGAGFLAGIGFTMALFIGGLAFVEPQNNDAAKIAVLGASAIAGIIGFVILLSAKGKPGEPAADTAEDPH